MKDLGKSIKAKFQLRDRNGYWITIGEEVKWYSHLLGREVAGTILGGDTKQVQVRVISGTGKSAKLWVTADQVEAIYTKASLSKREAEDTQAPVDGVPVLDADGNQLAAGHQVSHPKHGDAAIVRTAPTAKTVTLRTGEGKTVNVPARTVTSQK